MASQKHRVASVTTSTFFDARSVWNEPCGCCGSSIFGKGFVLVIMVAVQTGETADVTFTEQDIICEWCRKKDTFKETEVLSA